MYGATHKDDLEQHLLVNLHELLVPLLDIRSLLPGVGIVIGRGSGVVLVMFAPFNNLAENSLVDLEIEQSVPLSCLGLKRGQDGPCAYIGNGDRGCELVFGQILRHVLDQHGLLSNEAV